MNNTVYKLMFPVGVHFGNGMLNDSMMTFRADTLFSALYIEALKMEYHEEFLDAVTSGRLLFSDAFPYVGDTYMLPKPMLYIEPTDKGNSEEKKKYKKLKYIPVSMFWDYLKGKMSLEHMPMDDFGMFVQHTKAAVRKDEETLPYHVGTFVYHENNGLYLILSYETDSERMLFEELMDSLSLQGIGGKRSSGLGRFELRTGKNSKLILELLENKSDTYMLLSTALPKEEELEKCLEGASYLLEKRSGFIASTTYAEEYQKKKDLYVFSAGSCFKEKFSGDIFDVSINGKHPVYRYAKGIFLGV